MLRAELTERVKNEIRVKEADLQMWREIHGVLEMVNSAQDGREYLRVPVYVLDYLLRHFDAP